MKLNLEDFKYELPEEKIAQHPLKERSASKLLHYNKGAISHKIFREITDLLPHNSQLIFNNTRVIPARLFFTKSTGAIIEIFLLEPLKPFHQREKAMEAVSPVEWRCMIRNLKKWKEDELSITIAQFDVTLYARLIDRENQIVQLSWKPSHYSFAEIVESAGKIPLPPYMKREATEEDQVSYQTVYANQKGAVAAPTAGLHFTPEILNELKSKGIKHDYLTLHVSAGTFQPIKEEDVHKHKMHEEEIVIKKGNLQFLLANKGPVIPVGTTSMRTLESLYWFGVKLISDPEASFFIPQMYPYQEHADLPPKKESLERVLKHLEENQLDNIIGSTEIFIYPGYTFRICEGLITNFHLPGSTLILLIAALVGDDWKKIYEEALKNDYRFLSYGDSSLLIP
ncbi:MAG: S-adenosylmethionine:tRNA ribosyltransferase-isomerase [Candidatus Cyclobacteriaceae bacterium M2_1C_046]